MGTCKYSTDTPPQTHQYAGNTPKGPPQTHQYAGNTPKGPPQTHQYAGNTPNDHNHDHNHDKKDNDDDGSQQYAGSTRKAPPQKNDPNHDQKDNNADYLHQYLTGSTRKNPSHDEKSNDQKSNDNCAYGVNDIYIVGKSLQDLSREQIYARLVAAEAALKAKARALQSALQVNNNLWIGDISQIDPFRFNDAKYDCKMSYNFLDQDAMDAIGIRRSWITGATRDFITSNINLHGLHSLKALLSKIDSDQSIINRIKRYNYNIVNELNAAAHCVYKGANAPGIFNWKFTAPSLFFHRRRNKHDMVISYDVERGAAEWALRQHIRVLAPLDASLKNEDITRSKFIQGEQSNLIKITTMVEFETMVDFHINYMCLVKLGYVNIGIGSFELWNSDLSKSLQRNQLVGPQKKKY